MGKIRRALSTARLPAASLASAVLVVGAAAGPAVAEPLPDGLGPCLGDACPDSYPEPHNGGLSGRDNNINVFVGGDFLVRQGAAEAEGKVVVMGGYDQDKDPSASGIYNVGIAGVGSRVPPDDGTDFITTGGDLTVAQGERLAVEAADADGVARIGGTFSGVVESKAVRDPDAARPYTGIREHLTDASHCYAYDNGARRTPTGTAVNDGSTTTFTGDGSSPIQVFDVDFDLISASGGSAGYRFAGIPSGATVLVNVYGDARKINTYEDLLPPELRDRLLWNFPDASSVELAGGTQFSGSTLVGNPSSTTTMTMSGFNGRFYSAGSLTHTSPAGAGGGQEIHAYPFVGDLPTCEDDSLPTPTPTPTPTTPTPTPTSPTPTPSPTTPTPTLSPTTPTPTPSDTTPAPTPSDGGDDGGASGGSTGGTGGGGELADTGTPSLGTAVLGSIAAVTAATGAGAVYLTRRQRRANGRA
ncbi:MULTISPECIES: choice-of-anchor A family protein [unclassified Streptomyces]|uniref:choice-of-anchor A family protein n=1 Tax=unclassified Streptomyces TaxID=2593676 RepID=UPI00278C80C8|nr:MULTISPECIES: choice-of-anchor A family protein [unclassified Streptomyces]